MDAEQFLRHQSNATMRSSARVGLALAHFRAGRAGPALLQVLLDDLLATGGTVDATVKLIRRAGGEVADAAFIISLPSLGGDARLTAAGVKVVSLVELAGA